MIFARHLFWTLLFIPLVILALASPTWAQTPSPRPQPPAVSKVQRPTAADQEKIDQAEKARKAALAGARAAALPYWQEVIKRYATVNADGTTAKNADGSPAARSPRVEQAMYNVGVLLYEAAEAADQSKAADAWKQALSALKAFTDAYPKSAYAGDAYVRQTDIALERLWDLPLARRTADAGLAGAAQWPQKQDEAGPVANRPPSEPDKARSIAADELYVRAGLLAYLAHDYDRAAAMFTAASPMKAKDAKSGRDDLPRVGVDYLMTMAVQKRPVLTGEALDEAKTDVQRAAIELAELYFQGMRPANTEMILQQFIDGNRALGAVPAGLKAYATVELAAALERQDGKEEKAIALLGNLAQQQYKGTYWGGYGLFRKAIYIWNSTQDAKAALPVLQAMREGYPNHPKAEDALYYYILIAAHAHKTDLVSQATADFLKLYPHSDKKQRVETLASQGAPQRAGERP